MILSKAKIIEIVKLIISNDIDLSGYDFDQLHIYTIHETLERANQETKTLEYITSETIKVVVCFPVSEKDKTTSFYRSKKEEGIELEYLPWGYEIYIKGDGFVSYENGSGVHMYYPNSIKVLEILKENGYPHI